MDESVEALVGYLSARVETLKASKRDAEGRAAQLDGDNAQLRAQLAEAQRELDDLRLNDGAVTPQGTPGGAQAVDPVSEYVLSAAQAVSEALIKPLGSRPDLDIRGMMFLRAIRSGNADKVRGMVGKDPDLMQMRSLSNKETFGFTPLHVAADVGKAAVCEALVALGADPAATDLVGRTPLHIAAAKLHNEAVLALMRIMGDVKGEQAPQDASGITPAGYSALSKAKRESRADTLQLLHAQGDACISPAVHTRHSARRSALKSKNRKSTLYADMIVQRHRQTPGADAPLAKSGDVDSGAQPDDRAADLIFGSASLPGYRVAMEDSVCLATAVGAAGRLAVFAVFDGHGGRGASEYCANHFLPIFEAIPAVQSGLAHRDRSALSAAVRETFLELDRTMALEDRFRFHETVVREAMGDETRVVERKAQERSGTTATVAVVAPDFTVVANLGDSRTLLLEGGEVVLATRDHKEPTESRTANPEQDAFWAGELDRIKRAGGAVIEGGRVVFDPEGKANHLAMTRALGDFDFKQNVEDPLQQVIVPEPELYVRDRHAGQDQVLVLACDGIWDVMSNEDCAARVVQGLADVPVTASDKQSEALDALANDVALACLDSHDNLSVVLVRLAPVAAPAPGSGPRAHDTAAHEHRDVQRNLMNDFDQESPSAFDTFEVPPAQHQGPMQPAPAQPASVRWAPQPLLEQEAPPSQHFEPLQHPQHYEPHQHQYQQQQQQQQDAGGGAPAGQVQQASSGDGGITVDEAVAFV